MIFFKVKYMKLINCITRERTSDRNRERQRVFRENEEERIDEIGGGKGGSLYLSLGSHPLNLYRVNAERFR